MLFCEGFQSIYTVFREVLLLVIEHVLQVISSNKLYMNMCPKMRRFQNIGRQNLTKNNKFVYIFHEFLDIPYKFGICFPVTNIHERSITCFWKCYAFSISNFFIPSEVFSTTPLQSFTLGNKLFASSLTLWSIFFWYFAPITGISSKIQYLLIFSITFQLRQININMLEFSAFTKLKSNSLIFYEIQNYKINDSWLIKVLIMYIFSKFSFYFIELDHTLVYRSDWFHINMLYFVQFKQTKKYPWV